MQIAIDGPSGSGKSTLAKMLAKELDIIYIDTGSMYRAIAYFCIKKGVDLSSEKAVSNASDSARISVKYSFNEQKLFLNDVDVSTLIRTQEVAQGASQVAKYKTVRKKIVERLQKLSSQMDCIMDGRDIGTVVMPFANVKIFLTASVDERARRRYQEYIEKNIECDLEKIKEEISERDYADTTREISPLAKAGDAIEVDTTAMTLEEVKAEILSIIKKHGN